MNDLSVVLEESTEPAHGTLSTMEVVHHRCAWLTADDLRHALMTHSKYLGDIGHRQAILVGDADRLVAVGTQAFGGLLELARSPVVLRGKRS